MVHILLLVPCIAVVKRPTCFVYSARGKLVRQSQTTVSDCVASDLDMLLEMFGLVRITDLVAGCHDSHAMAHFSFLRQSRAKGVDLMVDKRLSPGQTWTMEHGLPKTPWTLTGASDRLA